MYYADSARLTWQLVVYIMINFTVSVSLDKFECLEKRK